MGGVDQVIPVDQYIPGCPCRPEVIIAGLARLFEEIEGTREQETLGTDPADEEGATIGFEQSDMTCGTESEGDV
jgi:NADH:ubiquinone oxidoreductase subunit B-like Fe-S oxidoreductase